MLFRWLTGLAVCAALTGCASLPDALFGKAPPPLEPADRFVLQPGQEVVGEVYVLTAKHDDTLPILARRYGLGFDEIVGANPDVDIWIPGEGTDIVLPMRFVLPDAPLEGIVINVAARRLFYFPADEPGVVVTYPVGIGRDDWATPLGAAQVTDKIVDPAWYPPASIRAEHAAKGDPLPGVVGPGPDNPLGKYALLLSMDGYLIHGTNKPAGVGMQVSHGCIRLYPENIAALFPGMPIGTPVRIVDQPLLAGWDDEELYVQSYVADTDGFGNGDLRPPVDSALQRRADDAGKVKLDWQRADLLRQHRRGVAIALTRGGPALKGLLHTASVTPD